jgi:hypothetical protein
MRVDWIFYPLQVEKRLKEKVFQNMAPEPLASMTQPGIYVACSEK